MNNSKFKVTKKAERPADPDSGCCFYCQKIIGDNHKAQDDLPPAHKGGAYHFFHGGFFGTPFLYSAHLCTRGKYVGALQMLWMNYRKRIVFAILHSLSSWKIQKIII